MAARPVLERESPVSHALHISKERCFTRDSGALRAELAQEGMRLHLPRDAQRAQGAERAPAGHRVVLVLPGRADLVDVHLVRVSTGLEVPEDRGPLKAGGEERARRLLPLPG